MKLDKLFDRRKVYAGLLIGAGAVLVYCLLTNLNAVGEFLGRLLGYITPITGGLMLAYLMRPMARKLEKLLPRFVKSEKARIHFGAIGALLIVVIIIVIIMYMLIPQLLYSVTEFAKNIDDYLASAVATIEGLADKLNIENPVSEIYNLSGDKLIKEISNWATGNLNKVIEFAINFGSSAMNFLITLMIATYALLDRKNIKKELIKIEDVCIGKKRGERVNEILNRGDRLMMKFLSSNLIDALIIGAVNFVFLGIIKAPYQVLMAVMLGVTNYIPTFGPFIGGVICAAVLLVVKPGVVIIFIVFTLVLQQLDGNIIKPVLFGDSTGLSPFWVLVAIVVGGRMFGILGMILGVPVVALTRSVLLEILDKRYERKENEKQPPESTEIAEE